MLPQSSEGVDLDREEVTVKARSQESNLEEHHATQVRNDENGPMEWSSNSQNSMDVISLPRQNLANFHPATILTRAHGVLSRKRTGKLGGNITFEITKRRIEKQTGVRLTDGRGYRIKGEVKDVFTFAVNRCASAAQYVHFYVPTKYLDKIKPGETYSLAVSSIEELNADENATLFRETRVRELIATERAWLAGVIDGEGSIFVARVKGVQHRRGFIYVSWLKIDNSNRAFVSKVRDIIGKGCVNFVEETRSHWKDRWIYSGSGIVLRQLLPQILPYLLVKREVAQKMLEYLSFIDANPVGGGRRRIPSRYYGRLDHLYSAIKLLNEKGKDPPTSEVFQTSSAQSFNPNRRGPGSRTRNCRRLSEEEKAWLAGVIDGEGSIFLSKVIGANYRRGFFYRPQLAVSNSNRSLLVRVAEIIGEGTVQLAKKELGYWKTRWMYAAVSGVLREILPQILPYLIIKRAQAETMLQFFSYIDQNPIYGNGKVEPSYYEKLDSLYLIMKKLNRKGKLVAGGS